MAAGAPAATGWLMGRVKAVLSGDCIVIMGSTKAELRPGEDHHFVFYSCS